MTSQSGGGGGGIKGVTSDGLTPGGEIIAGALTAGDPNAALVPSVHTINGNLTLNEAPGNVPSFDDVLDVFQFADLNANNGANAVFIQRSGTENGHSYTESIVLIRDRSSSTAPMLRVQNNAGAQFQVDGDGVRIHGKLKTGASVAHVLGAYSGNAVEIFDEAGTSLGFFPLYA